IELAEAAGDAAEAEELTPAARRFLALAGDRALGLDTVQAEARLARALELTPLDSPERPEFLLRWAEVEFQAGRLREAADASDEAAASFRAWGDAEALARSLQLRSRVALQRGEGSHVALAAEAVDLLEIEAPGPALVAAYTQLTHAQSLAGLYAEAIASADRAGELAALLKLPEPARALSYRGNARARRGEADGIAEMERALVLLVEEGAGRDAAAVKGNIAIASYAIRGPGEALAAFEQAIAFSEERGLVEVAAHLESNCPLQLQELGRSDEALERIARCAVTLEAHGLTHPLIEPRAVELALRLARGEQGLGDEAEWLIETGRKAGSVDALSTAFASAAAALAGGEAQQEAAALLSELEQTPGTTGTVYYARHLPAMIRTALGIGDIGLAERLAGRLEAHYPVDEHGLCAARAEVAEALGDSGRAASLYAEAAQRWQEFGNVPERAYALLGQGRCLRALGEPAAEQPLREARKLFQSIGYKPALAETDALLNQVQAAAT
ncbi:MAG: hypothetical protein ACXVY6_01780, partial [Gaiellaceae bacterium]